VLRSGEKTSHWPVMNSLFEVEPLNTWMWSRVLGAAFVLLLLVEGEKAFSRRLAVAVPKEEV
jgi:hypothetical protein